MAQDDVSPISDESKALLEDVKKGKPRKFAMICRGVEVVSLVVYKRGNVEKHKKEAKQVGKGQFYFGTLEGQGPDIRFILARADGFERAPVKTASLKSFLEESADFKCKPLIEIRDVAPMVLDDDDPLVARFLKLQPAALAACDAHPDRAAEINSLCLQIGGCFDQGQTDDAQAKLAALEVLLAKTAGSDSPPAESQGEPKSEPKSEQKDEQKELAEALKKLKPLLDKVVDARPERKSELFAAMAQSANEIKERKFEAARKSLVELGKTLKSLATGGPSVSQAEQESAAFRERQQQLEPQLLAAQRASPEKSTALGNVWTFALQQADAANFANAAKAFDRLEEAIRGILSGPAETLVPEGTVKMAKVLLSTWKQARSETLAEIEKLRTALEKQLPNEDCNSVMAKVEQHLDGFAADLDKAVYGVSSQLSEPGPVQRAQKLIAEYRNRVRRDRLIQYLNNSQRQLGVEIRVEAIFLGLFDDLETALAG